MKHMLLGIPVLLLCITSVAVGDEPKPLTPTLAEQNQAFVKEYNSLGFALRQAKTEEECEKVVDQMEKLTRRVLEVAENNPKDPAVMETLVQAVVQEIWMENNSLHPGWGPDSPEVRAMAILLRDHVHNEKAAEACRRMSYGFRQECETFMRAVLKHNPHREARGHACLRLAQLLNARLQRADLLNERPEMVKRYEIIFGKDFIEALLKMDRAQAIQEIEIFFERAGREYSDVKLPFGGTIGEKAALELHEIRHLAVGKAAQEIDGEDQDGKRFKLSDFRGKAVLLYFWSEY